MEQQVLAKKGWEVSDGWNTTFKELSKLKWLGCEFGLEGGGSRKKGSDTEGVAEPRNEGVL